MKDDLQRLKMTKY